MCVDRGAFCRPVWDRVDEELLAVNKDPQQFPQRGSWPWAQRAHGRPAPPPMTAEEAIAAAAAEGLELVRSSDSRTGFRSVRAINSKYSVKVREGGKWRYNEVEMRKSMPRVALPKDISEHDFKPWLVYDLHRYYFFQGLSSSGALLLLAHFGPGKIAVEEDEVLLGDVQVILQRD